MGLFAAVCIFNISTLGAGEEEGGGDMGKAGKIILSREENSAKFHDKVLVLHDGDTVKVCRSSSEDKPDTCNAVFDCRVLSKHQASLTFRSGVFYLKDVGSSNGTFVNNFRLSKCG